MCTRKNYGRFMQPGPAPGPGNWFLTPALVKPGYQVSEDSKWREKQNFAINCLPETNQTNMQSLDVYKKEEGKIWQRKPSPSPEEG